MTRWQAASRSGTSAEEGGDLGLHLGVAIGGCHAGLILGPGLMVDLEQAPACRRQMLDRRRDDAAEDARSLAAAEDQEAQAIAGTECRIGDAGEGGDLAAHRIARDTRLGAIGVADALGRGEGGGDEAHARCQEAVGAPEDRVLLVQCRRHAREEGCRHGRESRVAAEAEHGVGPRAGDASARLKEAHAEAQCCMPARKRPSSGDAACGDHMHLGIGEFLAMGETAAIDDHEHAVTARGEGFRRGRGREDVAPRTAGREHDGAGLRTHPSPPGPTRLRVRARTMPMPRARARSEEPP